uniref:Acyl-CoA thioesterase n=1 Tax=Ditylenchus dipsaci TaxID=166011 RepID=A0A915D5E7_9BILA
MNHSWYIWIRSKRIAIEENVLAQALSAAYKTVPDGFLLNSFHCYFIRGGEEKVEIIYEVKRLRNGRNFCIRTVEALQNGKVIHTSEFSFQKFPNVAPPEGLINSIESRADFLKNGGNKLHIRGVHVELIADSVELRPCDHKLYTEGIKPIDQKDGSMKQYVWIKYKYVVPPEDFKLAHSTLAYLSDLTLVNTASLAFQPYQEFKLSTSLDHSLWVHEFRFDINEWLLYEQECVAHALNRSIVNARIWTKSGRLLASTSQEVLLYPQKTLAVKPFNEQIKSKL